MYTIYVTPAGFTCTCGHTQSAVAGGEAHRMAQNHGSQHHIDSGELNHAIFDYRRLVDENARLSQQVASNTSLMTEASALIKSLQAQNAELIGIIDATREKVEEQITKIRARMHPGKLPNFPYVR